MSRTKVFISYRHEDGQEIKDKISEKLKKMEIIIDKSEETDRSNYTDDTIWEYLKEKIADSSITICIVTPKAFEYKKENGKIEDWLYDEQRYSIQNRDNNRTNGMIAVYTDENLVYEKTLHNCNICKESSSVRTLKLTGTLLDKNTCNIKKEHKKNPCENLYDSLEDSYVSFVRVDDFLSNPEKFLGNATKKRKNKEQFDLKKEL